MITSADFTTILDNSGWTTGKLDVQWKVIDRVLYFQQSKGLIDWLRNFTIQAFPMMIPGDPSKPRFKVHVGFYAAYLANAEAIEALDYDRIVGYSQGAALGLITNVVRYLKTGSFVPANLVACPRCLKPMTTVVFDQPVICYQTKRDIVVKILGILGYKSLGIRFIFTNKIKKPKSVPWYLWMTGHTPEEYSALIETLS